MLLFVLISSLFVLTTAQDTDVCSQVFLMSQYCSSQGVNGTGSGGGEPVTYTVLEQKMDAKFLEIEARLIREFGEPPEVNYTAVEETIAQRFKGVEARVIQQLGEPPKVNYTTIDLSIQQRFERLEARVNGDGDEASIVDYSRIEQSIEARFKALQVHIDSKFARLVNDTELYQKAVEEMNRRINVSDCRDIRLEDAKLCNATGGVFDIYRGTKKYEVFCDTYTDHGGWTVFQRRMDGQTNFNRTWDEYLNGFGDRAGEFWLGLKNIHEILQGGTHELRIDLMDTSGRVRFAKYGLFHISGKARNYELLINSFSGDLPNSLTAHNGIPFSTFDRDHDTHRSYHCAQNRLGGWWYTNCGYSTLNGAYTVSNAFYWNGFGNIERSEMKFRRLEED